MRYIIGLGNYSMGDDGIGLRIVEQISERGLNRGFEAVEIATEGVNLLFYLGQETEKVVVIDAVDLGLAPGEFRLFRPSEADSTKSLARFTTHEGDILKVLELARSLGYFIPPMTILGIQPARLEPAMELSPALQERFEAYLQAALEEIGKDG